MGTPLIMAALNWAFSSAFAPIPFKPGVSIGPGLTALTRILRSLRSRVHVRAEGGFCGAIDAKRGVSFYGVDGGVENDGAAVGEKRKVLLDGEKKAFDVGVEGPVVARFGDGAKRAISPRPALAKRLSTRPF
jgi:hypothetical protein